MIQDLDNVKKKFPSKKITNSAMDGENNLSDSLLGSKLKDYAENVGSNHQSVSQ